MKTLHVDLGRTWRGGQSQALLLLRGLRARGHEAELLTLNNSPLSHRARAAGISVHTVATQAAGLRAALRLHRLLAAQRFRVLHVHDAHSLTAAWLAGAHHHTSVVASRRVVYPLRKGPLARARYLSARRILAVSHFVAQSAIASGLPPDRVEVIHDGVELPPPRTAAARRQARQRWNAGESDLLLGCLGVLQPDKGQQFLIRALPAIRTEYPSCRLVLAGDGPDRGDLQRLARDLGVEQAVRFAGFVEDTDAFYMALDLFLLPALLEGLSTSLLMAMAHGLPVVAMAGEAAAEVIDHGRTGFLLSDRKPQTITAAVRQLLADRQWAQSLGAAARHAICEGFTADHMVERTLQIYGNLASGVLS